MNIHLLLFKILSISISWFMISTNCMGFPFTAIKCYKRPLNATPQELMQAVDSFFVQYPKYRISCSEVKRRDTSCIKLSCEEAQKRYYERDKKYSSSHISVGGNFSFQIPNSDTIVVIGVGNAILYDDKYADICLRSIYIITLQKSFFKHDLSRKEKKRISEKFKVEFMQKIERILDENRKTF